MSCATSSGSSRRDRAVRGRLAALEALVQDPDGVVHLVEDLPGRVIGERQRRAVDVVDLDRDALAVGVQQLTRHVGDVLAVDLDEAFDDAHLQRLGGLAGRVLERLLPVDRVAELQATCEVETTADRLLEGPPRRHVDGGREGVSHREPQQGPREDGAPVALLVHRTTLT
jgi:hypothetical protein